MLKLLLDSVNVISYKLICQEKNFNLNWELNPEALAY